jgi:hypothetical protein
MGTFLDIAGSVIIAGLLLLAVLNSYMNVNQYALMSTMDLTVQGNLSEWLQIVQHDFRKIGYRISNPAWAIQNCDSSSISFVSDIDNNGTIDSISYYLGPASQVTGTENPRDRALYRVVSGQQTGGALGLTDFQLRYFDSSGNATWTPAEVKAMEIFIQVESPFPLDTTYVWSSWRGMIYPLNLQ